MTTPAEAFFDAIAGRYERAYALPPEASRARMERVLAALPAPPARVLDLGVGTGRELSALLDAGYAPTGVDVSRAMLERCARRARPVPLHRADFWTPPLPFGDDTFDAVIALHGTLAHPPSEGGEGSEGSGRGKGAIARLGRELARVVHAGACFVAEIPSLAWLDHLDAQPEADRRARRTGRRSCVYEDLVTGASIEATLLDEAGWIAALAPDWDARVQSIDELEWLVVAHRT